MIDIDVGHEFVDGRVLVEDERTPEVGSLQFLVAHQGLDPVSSKLLRRRKRCFKLGYKESFEISLPAEPGLDRGLDELLPGPVVGLVHGVEEIHGLAVGVATDDDVTNPVDETAELQRCRLGRRRLGVHVVGVRNHVAHVTNCSKETKQGDTGMCQYLVAQGRSSQLNFRRSRDQISATRDTFFQCLY